MSLSTRYALSNSCLKLEGRCPDRLSAYRGYVTLKLPYQVPVLYMPNLSCTIATVPTNRQQVPVPVQKYCTVRYYVNVRPNLQKFFIVYRTSGVIFFIDYCTATRDT